jgi:hypothetical protein
MPQKAAEEMKDAIMLTSRDRIAGAVEIHRGSLYPGSNSGILVSNPDPSSGSPLN